MSSGLCMYKIRPVINHDQLNLQTTHNMYKIRPVNGYIDKTPLVSLESLISGRVEQLLKVAKGDVSSLEVRQEEILKKLAELKLNMKNLREELHAKTEKVPSSCTIQGIGGCVKPKSACEPCCRELEGLNDIVVCASPQFPPFSLLGLVKAWGPQCPLHLRSYTHSSVSTTPEVANLFTTEPANEKPCLTITIIWKDVGPSTELTVNPLKHVTVRGETNILRFLSRVGPSYLSYEKDSDLVQITKVDELLDVCETLISSGNNKEKQSVIRSLCTSLGKGSWLCGRDVLSIADVAVWSTFKQILNVSDIPKGMTSWFERCNSHLGNI